jgi:hypothetical protein
MEYAILNSEGVCVNRVVWDGEADWQPPDGCSAVADPDNQRPICVEPLPEPEADPDPLASLTDEQKATLIALLQQGAP